MWPWIEYLWRHVDLHDLTAPSPEGQVSGGDSLPTVPARVPVETPANGPGVSGDPPAEKCGCGLWTPHTHDGPRTIDEHLAAKLRAFAEQHPTFLHNLTDIRSLQPEEEPCPPNPTPSS